MQRLVRALSLALPLVVLACGGAPSQPAHIASQAVARPEAPTPPRSPFDIGVVSANDEVFPSQMSGKSSEAK